MNTNANGHYSDPYPTYDAEDALLDFLDSHLMVVLVPSTGWASLIPADPFKVEGVDITPPF